MSRLQFKINVSIVIQNDDKFLLIKRSESEDIFPGYWGIPGGTVESEDLNLEAALMRECIEEVGITITNLQLISNNIVKKENIAVLYLVYSGHHQSGIPEALDSVSEVAWKTYNEAAKLKLTPHILEIIKRINKVH